MLHPAPQHLTHVCLEGSCLLAEQVSGEGPGLVGVLSAPAVSCRSLRCSATRSPWTKSLWLLQALAATLWLWVSVGLNRRTRGCVGEKVGRGNVPAYSVAMFGETEWHQGGTRACSLCLLSVFRPRVWPLSSPHGKMSGRRHPRALSPHHSKQGWLHTHLNGSRNTPGTARKQLEYMGPQLGVRGGCPPGLPHRLPCGPGSL